MAYCGLSDGWVCESPFLLSTLTGVSTLAGVVGTAVCRAVQRSDILVWECPLPFGFILFFGIFGRRRGIFVYNSFTRFSFRVCGFQAGKRIHFFLAKRADPDTTENQPVFVMLIRRKS